MFRSVGPKPAPAVRSTTPSPQNASHDENNNLRRRAPDTVGNGVVRDDFLESFPPKRAKRAADSIKSAWKDHLKHVANTNQERHFEEYRSTHEDYRTLAYEPENTDVYPLRKLEQDKWVFFCSIAKRPTLRYPIVEMPVESEKAVTVQGRFKDLQTLDDKYVALRPVADGTFMHRDEKRLDPLRATASLVFSAVINEKLIIARNAGTTLFDYLAKGGQLPMIVFQALVQDVDRLHALDVRGGAFVRDIKLENTCIRLPAGEPLPSGPLPSARLIDFEDDVLFGDELLQLRPEHARGTRECQTNALMQDLYAGPGAGRSAAANALDLYALLLMVVAATAPPGSDLQRAALCEHRQIPALDVHPGAMHDGNADLFRPWLEANVQAKHAEDILHLLTNPAVFARKHPERLTLAPMLRFAESTTPSSCARSNS
ncbi:hypothetical protein [Stenotrophomonas oahuensis]|uniref:Protein kinase domain-containing protein n=1 Tax=Stenotrophomonas oahuensis TaxID=3003271 RepID=A0ABY9YT70_9GAMM|nr:hypothetical protein [Stenotrophomonas sp. A5586]WNH53902.1 hypothetical protein PDM29_06365 [Stenotrophomonas sp. A5586]